MDSVVHFEIPADDLERAQKFYGDTFGWKIITVPGMNYTIVYTAPTGDETHMLKEPGAINGGMLKRQEPIKNPVITINVSNIDEAHKKIKAAGGEIIREKLAVGDMGFASYFKDTEGNVLGLFETAK